ncbi:hypothetical protein HET69_18430 [Streptomyces sp. CJ_13]|nr:hypothetical protein EES41_38995 [Streptomyces sp. ADI95-16]MBT1185923.1 hypothetical protein [Streptomyces sp. CJ_13]
MNVKYACCFCDLTVDVEQDASATVVRFDPLDPAHDGGVLRQQVHAHSRCLRDRVSASIDLWWEH